MFQCIRALLDKRRCEQEHKQVLASLVAVYTQLNGFVAVHFFCNFSIFRLLQRNHEK